MPQEAIKLKFLTNMTEQAQRFTDERPQISYDALVTALLENSLSDLESLRHSLEYSKMKDIDDVRNYGDTNAGRSLRGIEERITYTDLVRLIKHVKNGVAKRRVQLRD